MSEQPILSEKSSKEFKRASRRSSRRVAHMRHRKVDKTTEGKASVNLSAVRPQDTAKAKPSKPAVAGPTLKRVAKPGKFWADLFLVRPWLLLGGLWLVSVVMIAIALAGLSNPGREVVIDPVNKGIAGQPLSAPDAAAVSRLGVTDERSIAQRDPAATLPDTPRQVMPVWSVLVMVAACAGGCLLMTQQGGLSVQSRRGRRRVLGSPRPMRSSSRRRGKQQRRPGGQQRTAAPMMAFATGQSVQPATSQPDSAVSPVVAFETGDQAGPKSVTVVPTHEASPLDWKEGSLAHKLDVRQTRSVNSFL